MKVQQEVDRLFLRAKTLAAQSVSPNKERRELYSDIGLLELDVESLSKNGQLTESVSAQLLERLGEAGNMIKLGFLKNKPKGLLGKVLSFMDEALRIAAVWFWLIDCSIFVVPVTMAIHAFFPRLNMPGTWRPIVGQGCVKLSNVTIKKEGISDATFASTVSLLAFTHASTMDAFILAGFVPCGMYSVAKSELFLIPFFAWILSAYGGIAISRNDRNQAVNALKTSAERAKRNTRSVSGSCVAISPEGTRSKSGQLAAFKKGPFWMWEELQAPIVPMIIIGAYDLYPPGKLMSLPGVVTVRFLAPIHANEISATDPSERRAEMSSLLRRKTLLSLKECPPGIGDDSPPQSRIDKAKHLGLVGTCLGANYGLFRLGVNYCRARGWPLITVTAYLSIATVVISGGVYAYNLFLCNPSSFLPWRSRSSPQDKDKDKSIVPSESSSPTPPSGPLGEAGSAGKQKVL